MFIITNIIIIGLILKFILSKKDEINYAILTGLSLIVSGGAGNLIDRIFRGFVIDYIDVNKIMKFPVFNLADIFIIVGIIILAISVIINLKKQKT